MVIYPRKSLVCLLGITIETLPAGPGYHRCEWTSNIWICSEKPAQNTTVITLLSISSLLTAGGKGAWMSFTFFETKITGFWSGMAESGCATQQRNDAMRYMFCKGVQVAKTYMLHVLKISSLPRAKFPQRHLIINRSPRMTSDFKRRPEKTA